MRRILIAVFLALGLVSAAVPAARALDPDALRQDLIAALNRGLSAYATGPFLFTGVETVAQGAAVRVKITDLTLPLPDHGSRIEFGDLAFTLADAPPGSLEDDRRYLVSEVTTASQAAVIDDRRPGGGGHLGHQITAVVRAGTGRRLGQGEGQVTELDPAIEIGQRQRQIVDPDPDRGALGLGLDAGEQEGSGAVSGDAAVERRDQVLAQSVRVERPGRRRDRGDKAKG